MGDKFFYCVFLFVVVVGNIIAGGNGKIFVVVWLVEML